MEEKVNDNLQYGVYVNDVTAIRRRMEERSCLCPVCKPTTERTAEEARQARSDEIRRHRNACSSNSARSAFLAGRFTGSEALEYKAFTERQNGLPEPATVKPVGLLNVPNATGSYQGVTTHPAWVDAYLRDEGGRWEEDVQRTREIMRQPEPVDGWVTVYEEAGRKYCSWYPKGIAKFRPPCRQAGVTHAMTGKQTKRIKQACAMFDELRCKPVFMTLTFKEADTCQTRAKRDLDTFIKRLQRHRKDTSYLWVAEIQTKRWKRTGRPVIHFHLVASSRVDMQWYQRAWREITGQEVGQQDIRRIHGVSGVAKYMSGYLTKSQGPIVGRRYGMSRNLSRMIKKKVLVRAVSSTYSEFCQKSKELPNCRVIGDFVVSFENGYYHD